MGSENMFTHDQVLQFYYWGLLWLWIVPIFLPSALAFGVARWIRPRFVFFFLLPVVYGLSLFWYIPAQIVVSDRTFADVVRALMQPTYMIPNVITIVSTYVVAIAMGILRLKRNSNKK